jgi:hypothetical protein
MSQIMSSMPWAGLIEMPPVSKQTPLPTKAMLAAVPLDDRQLALAHRALADAQEDVHAQLAHLLLAQDLDLEAERLQRLDAAGELFGIEDVGRLGDEVAREVDGVGDGVQGLERGGGGLGVLGDDVDRLDRRNLLRLLFGPVLVEAIGGQAHSEGGASRLFGRQMRQVDRQRLQPRQLDGVIGRAHRRLQRQVVELGRVARPAQDHQISVQTCRSGHQRRGVGAAGEPAGPHRLGQDTRRGGVVVGARAGKRTAVMDENSESARAAGVGDEIDREGQDTLQPGSGPVVDTVKLDYSRHCRRLASACIRCAATSAPATG